MESGLIIEQGPIETRCARIEDGVPVAFGLERRDAPSVLGNIYWARVREVNKAMNAAFLDLGKSEGEALLSFSRAKSRLGDRSAGTIKDCVREGESLAVQIYREALPVEAKLARATTRITLAGRYVELRDGEPKTRLLQSSASPEIEAAAVAEAAALLDDWHRIAGPANEAGLLRAAPQLAERVTRDLPADPDFILADDATSLNELRRLTAGWPDIAAGLKRWDGDQPSFEAYGVEARLDAVRAGRFELSTGGALLQGEGAAMTTFDVNMAGRPAANHRRAVLAANLEAVVQVASELRFQNIGGLVAVDLIDMNDKSDQKAVLAALDVALKADPQKVERGGISRFGIVELRRRMTGPALRDLLLAPPTREEATVSQAAELLRRAERDPGARPGAPLVLSGADAVIAWLGRRPDLIKGLASRTGRQVLLESGHQGSAKEAQG